MTDNSDRQPVEVTSTDAILFRGPAMTDEMWAGMKAVLGDTEPIIIQEEPKGEENESM